MIIENNDFIEKIRKQIEDSKRRAGTFSTP